MPNPYESRGCWLPWLQCRELVVVFLLHGMGRALQKRAKTVPFQPVVDIRPAFFARDHTGFTQDAKMPGNGGHVIAHQFPELAHAFLAIAQGVNHEQAAWMPECLEYFCLLGDGAVMLLLHVNHRVPPPRLEKEGKVL